MSGNTTPFFEIEFVIVSSWLLYCWLKERWEFHTLLFYICQRMCSCVATSPKNLSSWMALGLEEPEMSHYTSFEHCVSHNCFQSDWLSNWVSAGTNWLDFPDSSSKLVFFEEGTPPVPNLSCSSLYTQRKGQCPIRSRFLLNNCEMCEWTGGPFTSWR